MSQALLSARGQLWSLAWHCAICPHPGSVTRLELVTGEQTTGPWSTQGFRTILRFYHAPALMWRFVKTQITGPHLGVSHSVGLGSDDLNKFPGDSDVTDP